MTQPVKQVKSTDRTLLQCVLFTFLVSGAASQPLGSFIPFLRQSYGFSYEISGMMLSFQSIGNLAAVLIAGFLPAYWGRRKSILLMSMWMVAAYAIFASGIGSPLLLLTACLMTGIARGANSNFSNTMISTLSPQRAARGYNLLHGSFAIGALLSPLVLVLLTTQSPDSGWRIMAGVLALLCVSQLAVYGRMPLPEEPPKSGLRGLDVQFLKNKRFWLGAAMLFFYISTEYAIVGWLVTYFQDIGVLSANVAQLSNSLLWLVIFAGRMVGAAVSGRLDRSVLLVIDGVGLCGFFLLMFFSSSALPVLVGLIGVGFFMATIYPTAFAFGSDAIQGNDLGCSIMIFTGSIGGIVTPALVGFVAQRSGISAGMGLVAMFTVLLLASILLSVWSAGAFQKRKGV